MNSPLPRAIRAMRPDLWRVVLAAVVGVAALGCAIGLLGVSGWLISRAAQQPPVLYLMVAVVSVRALGIGRGVLRYAERLASHDVALRGVVNLRESVFARLASSDPAMSAGLRRGDLLARLGADVDALGDVVVRSFLPVLTAGLTGVLCVGVLLLVLPAAGAVLAAGLLVAGVVAPLLAARGARDGLEAAAGARADLSERVQAFVDGLDELAVAGVAADRLSEMAPVERDLAAARDRAARGAGAAAALSSLALGVTLVACLALGVQAVSAGVLAPVMLAVVVLVPLALAEAVGALPAAATGLVIASAAAVRVMALLDPAPVRSAPLFRDFDLPLPRGRRIAVVGPSGAGKTTLLRTLARANPDARLIADDAHVFATTVRENLRLAEPGASDDQLSAVLHRARLPVDLGTLVSDPTDPGRAPLSGGERRRLLVARALLGQPSAVLVDEPGEHLDPDTADALVRELFTAAGGPGRPAVVVVTHRLAPLAAADEVLLVDSGRITARGSHDNLIHTCPAYRDAWAAEH